MLRTPHKKFCRRERLRRNLDMLAWIAPLIGSPTVFLDGGPSPLCTGCQDTRWAELFNKTRLKQPDNYLVNLLQTGKSILIFEAYSEFREWQTEREQKTICA